MIKSNNSIYAKDIHSIPLLSSSETKKLFYDFYDGNMEARKKIIAHNMRIVLKLAIFFEHKNDIEAEELISVGSIGLIQAVDTYRIDAGYAFSTYANMCIKNQILNHLVYKNSAKRNNSNIVSLNTKIVDDDIEVTFEDILLDETSDVLDILIDKYYDGIVFEELSKLKQRYIDLIRLRYGFGNLRSYSFEEIASIFGTTKQNEEQKHTLILRKLRKSPELRKIYNERG